MRARLFTIKDNASKRSIMTAAWDFVSEAIQSGALDITVSRASKTRAQESRYHAMIGDIFKQVEFKDEHDNPIKSDRAWIKAVLIDDFGQEMLLAGTPLAKPGRSVMSLDKMRILQIRPSSSDFRVKEASQFIEYLFAFGAQENVRWTDPETQSMYKDYFAIQAHQ
jgi:hypothetical protein